MLLKLKNFKTWEEAEFEFADCGLSLLSGPSGAGKTSILQAIYFALYGEGSKVVRHGNTSCRVELVFNGMNIVRTKRPNRLVLVCSEGTFEDKPAQDVLDRMFGKNFDSVSYVEQDGARNLLNMTPGSRLEFLESFAFENIDIEKLKENLKNELKLREGKVTAAKSSLETCLVVLERTPIPLPREAPAVPESDISQLSAAVTALEQQTARAEKEVERNREELKRIELSERELVAVEKSIEDVSYIGDGQLSELKKRLQDLEKYEEQVRLTEELRAMREECERMLSEETDMHKRRVETATKGLWNRLPECNANELLRCFQNRAERSAERKVLSQRVAELEHDYNKYLEELPKAGNVTKCPSCACGLTVVTTSEGSQVFPGTEVSEAAKATVKRLVPAYKEYVRSKSKLEELMNDIPLIFEGEVGCGSVTSPEWTLQSLEKYIKENIQAEARSKAQFQPSSTLVSMQKRLQEADQCKGRFSVLSGYVPSEEARPESIDEVRRTVSVEENKRVVYAPLARKRFEILKLLENKNFKILKTQESELEGLRTELAAARQALTAGLEAKIAWDAYRTHLDEMRRRTVAENAVKEAEAMFSRADSELQTATRLKSIVLEAESASLESVVSTLNMHAQSLLEAFFPKNPISVSLVTFKEAKSGKDVYKKPTIDVQVEYKGNETDIGSLSGGERARVALAYTLALAELQGSRMLLLDESISSLDYEATVDVLEAIKNVSVDRPVICISHQANTGMFDGVVTVG